MEEQKVKDLSTAQTPKATDFVMLITNLTNNVLEKCQLTALRDILFGDVISEDEGNTLTTGSDDKLYVPETDLSSRADLTLSNVTSLSNSVKSLITNDYATKDLSNTTSPIISAPYIKDTWEQDTEGYRIWSDGYCEQWGFIPSSTGEETIYFIKKFANTNYCWANGSAATSSDTLTHNRDSGYNRTVNGFTIRQGWFGSWKASGYLAEGEY